MWFFVTLGLLMLIMLLELFRQSLACRNLYPPFALSQVRGLKIFQVAELQPGNNMKRFSLTALSILISFVGLTLEGAAVAIDGLFNVVSSDTNVLVVSPTETVGVFKVEFVGPGQASLQVSADADLGVGIQLVSQSFDFEIYDPSQQADHFDMQILSVEHADGTTSVMGVGAETVDATAAESTDAAAV